MDAIAKVLETSTLDPRTWRNWFKSKPPRARSDAIACLDRCAAELQMPHSKCLNFYQELITGGFVRRLLAPTKSTSPETALWQRAREYVPISSLHLHFDAMEVAALAVGNGSADWETLKTIAAERVMEILHSLWNPRTGTIYSTFSSDLALDCEVSSGAEHAEIRPVLERFSSAMFDAWMSKPPKPNFEAMSEQRDLSATQVHRILLALAADTDFLRADRMNAWSIDLASAAFALHALAWVHRYEMFVHHIEPETIYLDALQSLLYREGGKEDQLEFLSRAHHFGRFMWTSASYEKLICAKSNYHALLSSLGVSSALMSVVGMSCESVHPIVLKP